MNAHSRSFARNDRDEIMKRYGNLYSLICSFENLCSAWQKARKASPNNPETLEFGFNLEKNLLDLQNELETGRYRPGRFRRFMINDPKPREICAAPFRDRVVHHAVYNVVEPIFDRSFIHDSFACRKDRGSHSAVERLSGFLENPKNKFCLKCDISKYFFSVNHRILMPLIERKIKDARALALLGEIIKSNDRARLSRKRTGLPIEDGKGMPIGSLTSQLFANVYLAPLDYYAKFELNARYYIRYVDDFIFLSGDLKWLECIREKMRDFLAQKLKLTLHPSKAVIFPSKNGIDFLGFRVFSDRRKIRKSGLARFRKKFKSLRRGYFNGRVPLSEVVGSVASYIGHWRWADSRALRLKIFGGGHLLPPPMEGTGFHS